MKPVYKWGLPLQQNARIARAIGVMAFIGMMAAGYYYNVTFIQLGLDDLGGRVLGLERGRIGLYMTMMAVLTGGSALLVGRHMMLRPAPVPLLHKLRIAWGVIVVQTLLTLLVPLVRSELAYILWIAGTGLTLGIGIPATFGLAVDLVPVRARGMAAGLATAGAYAASNLIPAGWEIEQLQAAVLPLLAIGVVGLGVMVWAPWPIVGVMAAHHTDPAYAHGRFVGPDGRLTTPILIFLLLMFGAFFVDSLGFLRLVQTPEYMIGAWRSPDPAHRQIIAAVHVITALIAGILYTYLDRRVLFMWIFGTFALSHLMYGLHTTLGGSANNTLGIAVMYATAVSLYTVLTFTLWADLSTPRTIPYHAALGVTLSGWTATFISTGLAMMWESAGMSFAQHIRLVNAIALLFLVVMFILLLVPGWQRRVA